MHRLEIVILAVFLAIESASARSLPGGDGGSTCESFSPLPNETCAMLFDKSGNEFVPTKNVYIYIPKETNLIPP